MEPPNPSTLRVLIRPPSSSSSSATAAAATTSSSAPTNPPNLPPQDPTPLRSALPSNSSSSSSSSTASSSSSTTTPSLEGVVVVGFLGNRGDDVTHLINRVLDANFFGFGGLDRDLAAANSNAGDDQREDWFRHRRISYYHQKEKGIVFLQFSSTKPISLLFSSLSGSEGGGYGLASVLEERESDDLRGMLLMFSVCHVIIFLHEGFRCDTHILKMFRMLQGVKHALAPFIRSHIMSLVASKASSSLSKPTVPTKSSISIGRIGSSRHGSAISLMSGSGSHTSVLPGQCTPVVLFVFHDEFLDGPSTGFTVEDLADSSSLNQSSNLSGMPRPSVTSKGSNSVVMLARPISKTEGSFRKKLQASLEVQIRFLIKKCRTLSGTESGHSSSRGAGNLSSLPLFSLDASRVVVLLDRSTNHRGACLDFVTDLIGEVLNSKTDSDMLMLENNRQSSNNEDIQSIKDFIYRQSDTLRGRGALPTSTSSGSAAGVGMVAAAAAAAAASAVVGKPFSAPELPSLENWLSTSNLILDILLSVKRGPLDENRNMKRISLRQNATAVQDEGTSVVGNNAVEAAISWLESSRDLNLNFSTSWCQRALPAAKDVYLKELPTCYPTALHRTQLQKALHAFHLLVKGPAVQMFAKKLEDECTSIWESGRQLCDAVSLTGKPCMHQRHHVKTCSSSIEVDSNKHSSGFVFLHACACGRSRRLRDDPFDFESANTTFSCFPDCEHLLPTLVLPEGSKAGPLHASSWNLIRLGGARYYDPSKGLLQSGFCSTENFLLKWTISLEKQKETRVGLINNGRIVSSTSDPKVVPVVAEDIKKADIQTGALENQRRASDNISSDDSTISFGKGFPSFVMKKAFSEVVAGTVSVAPTTVPLLQQRKQPKAGSEKCVKQMGASSQANDQAHLTNDREGSKSAGRIPVMEGLHTNSQINGDPFLKIGSNVVPVNMKSGGNIKPRISLKQIVIYVGFEHECSHGHRFLLSTEHLKELGSSYSLPEESHLHSTEDSNGKYAEKPAELNITKDGLHKNVHIHSGGKITATVSNMRKKNRSSETKATYSPQCSEKEHYQSGFVENLEKNLPFVRLDDGEAAFSLLNRNLPVYMNCPHCKNSMKMDQQKIKFASTISQLQRIFLVTPPFPIVLSTCPVVQFEDSCLPPSVHDREQQSRFSLGCRVILPPESFLTFRLPFVYGVQLNDRSLVPLNHLEHQPELTAWLTKGSVLQVISKEFNVSDDFNMD